MPTVEKNQANLAKCACTICPSYNKCAQGKKELLYCALEVGKSTCQYKMDGCTCGNCPVHQEHKLKTGYYCIKGSANEAMV